MKILIPSFKLVDGKHFQDALKKFSENNEITKNIQKDHRIWLFREELPAIKELFLENFCNSYVKGDNDSVSGKKIKCGICFRQIIKKEKYWHIGWWIFCPLCYENYYEEEFKTEYLCVWPPLEKKK